MGNKSTLIDMTGVRPDGSMLTVIDYAGNGKWNCICDCGNKCRVHGKYLRSGSTKSCGCLQRLAIKSIGKSNYKHGGCSDGKSSRLYCIWQGMRDRCSNPSFIGYQYYGAKGITVCDEWNGVDGFSLFQSWALSNGYQSDLTIDRIDSDKGYNPDNCRWVSYKTQNNNRKHYNLEISYNGEIHTVSQWSDITGIPYQVIWDRLHQMNWSVDKALSTPVGNRFGK